MNLKLKSGLLCLSVFLIAFLFLSVATVSAAMIDPVELADSLGNSGNHFEAITEYKRFLFFKPDDSSRALINRRIGQSYMNSEDWENAASYYRRAVGACRSDSLRSIYKIEQAVSHIAAGNYSSAELILIKLSYFSKQAEIRRRASFFLIINYIYRHKWRQAREMMEKIRLSPSPSPSPIAASDSLLLSALVRASETGYKSPGKARWMSTLVPGLGQAYAGKPLHALNATAINATFGYLLYYQINAHADALEVLSYITLFMRYWAGNRNHAARFADEYNHNKDISIEEKLLKIIDRNID